MQVVGLNEHMSSASKSAIVPKERKTAPDSALTIARRTLHRGSELKSAHISFSLVTTVTTTSFPARQQSRQHTMKVQKMVFAHVAHLFIKTLGHQIIVSSSQGKALGAGAAGKLFGVA
jgi:hypothetical protein